MSYVEPSNRRLAGGRAVPFTFSCTIFNTLRPKAQFEVTPLLQKSVSGLQDDVMNKSHIRKLAMAFGEFLQEEVLTARIYGKSIRGCRVQGIVKIRLWSRTQAVVE